MFNTSPFGNRSQAKGQRTSQAEVPTRSRALSTEAEPSVLRLSGKNWYGKKEGWYLISPGGSYLRLRPRLFVFS